MARGSLTPYSYGSDPFQVLRQEVDQLFDNMWRSTGLPTMSSTGSQAMALMPRIDVSETDNELSITADLPGVTPNDVSVTLNDDILTISGERKVERREERKNFHVMERSQGVFQRSLRLPFAVEPNQVQAHFEDGVLRVTLPKSAAKQLSQRIPVQAGGGSLAGAPQQQRIPSGEGPAGQTAGGGQETSGGDVRH